MRELAKILADKGQVKDQKLFETLVLTMGTLSRKTTHAKLSSAIMQLLISGLQECKTQACILVHLRGLRNTQVGSMTKFFLVCFL